MNRALVITTWTDTPTRHAAIDEQFSLETMDDITGQANVLPDPNLLVVNVTCDDTTLAAMEATGAVLWSEVIEELGALRAAIVRPKADKGEKPTKATKTALKNLLKARGVTNADALTLARENDTKATRAELAQAIIEYCAKLPKAKNKARISEQ